MSKLRPPQTVSKTKAPSKSAISKQPSVIPSKTQSKKDTAIGDKAPPKKGAKKTEWALPPLSILPKKPKQAINWEDLKKKTIRRQAPEGEDFKSIKAVLKELKEHNVPVAVHDFINMVGAFTGDNGACLRHILEEDVDSFRKLARKVYETQTQDVSDVLVNEQLQLANYYQERHDIYTEKMMNGINEIYEMAPQFEFDRYFRDKDEYLDRILPLPIEITKAPEELEMQRRQMAYHRLQWLRTEGERMHDENMRLQQRLEQLKTEQKNEQMRMAEAAAKAEEERQKLAKEEAEMKDQLQNLEENVERSIIENEAQITQIHRAQAMDPSTGAIKKTKSGVKQKKQKRQKRKPEWVGEVAADIEDRAVQEVLMVEKEAAADDSRPRRRLMRRQESAPRAAPPPREKSPFHFSPDRAYRSPPPRQDDLRVESHSSRVEERRQSPQPGPSQQQEGQPRRAIQPPQFRTRRGQAPKDSWGGF